MKNFWKERRTHLTVLRNMRGTKFINDNTVDSRQRAQEVLDEGYESLKFATILANPLNFDGYLGKKEEAQRFTNLDEAASTFIGEIDGHPLVTVVMDRHFMMGSMGSYVGEQITASFEYATEHKLPIVIFCASGGARMQEGMFSLMQMAKTAAAAKRHSEEGLLYISCLTNPTTGGVTASFAYLGDIIIAEPNALIGFAGPRVIEQTMRQPLPEGFQRAEFLLKKGFIDSIVPRNRMRERLGLLLALHEGRKLD